MFPCSQCGECCRNLHRSALYTSLDRGDGTCRYLKGNLCSIYHDRPLLCRIEETYDTFFCDIMDKDSYIRLNLESCITLQREKKGV